MEWVKLNLNCRANQEDSPLQDGADPRRSVRVKPATSSDWVKGQPKDMLAYTLRCSDIFYTTSD